MKKPGRNIHDLAKHNTAQFILLEGVVLFVAKNPNDPQDEPAGLGEPKRLFPATSQYAASGSESHLLGLPFAKQRFVNGQRFTFVAYCQ